MYLPLWYDLELVDEGFGAYICWGEDLSRKVYDYLTHFIVTFNHQAFFAAAKWVMYIEGCVTAVAFALDVGGGG